MRRLPAIVLLTLAVSGQAQEAAAPPASEQRALLKQAFDGAMTCSALTALKADTALGDARQQWANRSFAFGMLAVKFYTDLTSAPLSNDDLNDALNQYADQLATMVEAELAPFEQGCAEKYADMDRLCVENGCVFDAPGAAAAPPGPATE